jgi:hypothetical protein
MTISAISKPDRPKVELAEVIAMASDVFSIGLQHATVSPGPYSPVF